MVAGILGKRKNRKIGQWPARIKSATLSLLPILRVALPLAAIAIAGSMIHDWLRATPRFAMKKLLVNPCEHVEVGRVRDFVDARLGTNLFTVDLAHIHRQLKDHPWVKEVRVTRQLPDTLMITIREHQPYAVINLGKLYYVDRDGFLFKRLEKGERRDYPILSGFSATDFLAEGEAARRNMKRLRQSVDLVALAEHIGAAKMSEISEVKFDPLIGFSLVLEPKGMQLRLGTGKFERKLQRFRTIREQLGDQTLALPLINLVNPEQAVIKGLRKVKEG